jgi:tRNA pseudouridine38-40 synthase
MRIALGIEYDGSHFCGWQIQKDGSRTVQGELEKALSAVANEPIQVVCAGRTDTGVHATGQVVNFDTTAVRDKRAWIFGVNTHLPVDISSLWSSEVKDDFSARFTAVARQYRYIILNRLGRSAAFHSKVTWRHGPINEHLMHEAAQVLVGEHDYSSFRSSSCQADHARRNIHYVNVTRKGEFIYIDIKANAFLHHMVRNIAGSLLMIGQGEKPVDWMQELLQIRDRTQAGPTAPAAGLYMVKVSYPEGSAIPEYCFLPEFA